MQPTTDQIKRFQELNKQVFGAELSDQQIYEQAASVARLIGGGIQEMSENLTIQRKSALCHNKISVQDG